MFILAADVDIWSKAKRPVVNSCFIIFPMDISSEATATLFEISGSRAPTGSSQQVAAARDDVTWQYARVVCPLRPNAQLHLQDFDDNT